MAPMPSDMSASGPSLRCSRSPEFISSIRFATGFRWNQGDENHCIRTILWKTHSPWPGVKKIPQYDISSG